MSKYTAGDVQPYVALGKRLVEDGHRVRLASHETFRQFVTNSGLEFFNIGGNPQDLMSYMVKSKRSLQLYESRLKQDHSDPGLVPGFDSLTNGDIAKKRKMLTEMIDGCWEACHAPCPLSGRTFAADAIISNPPTFAHVHCAEALGIPLLLTFSKHMSSFCYAMTQESLLQLCLGKGYLVNVLELSGRLITV